MLQKGLCSGAPVRPERSDLMIKAVAVAIISSALWGEAFGQAPSVMGTYTNRPVIEHHTCSATVKANSTAPLGEAVFALNKEYGWVVDYEDPPYAGADLTIRPSPVAGGPPDKIVAGGAFQSTYRETPHMWDSDAIEPEVLGDLRARELEVLRKIVSDYNASGNPGKFTVRQLPDGNFDVVGVATRDNSGAEVAITPILDTRVSVPVAPQTLDATLDAIWGALSGRIGGGLGGGYPPMGFTITVGGSNVPARDLLMQVVQQLGGNWAWELGYDTRPKQRKYNFGLGLVAQVKYDAFGRRRPIPAEGCPN